MERKPSLELGERDLDCEFYGRCLDEAAKNNWETFSCNDCPVYSGGSFSENDENEELKLNSSEFEKVEDMPEKLTSTDKEDSSKPEKQENTRRCECGKITISPGCPYCPSCMARRANEKKRAKKEAGEKQKKSVSKTKTASKDKRKVAETIPAEDVKPSSDESISIDFNKYTHLIEWLEQEAENQVRTLSEQIIWIVKTVYDSQSKVTQGDR